VTSGGFSILSPSRDFAWFLGPGIAAAVVGLCIGIFDPQPGGADTGLGLWIAGVLLVDVAHVWASLYRTYLDPDARRLHRARLVWAPLLCAWFGFLLHLESPLLFWGVLAYVAIFHFIKQHVGFALLYVRGGGESRLDRRLVEAAIWAGTLGPVLWWHANLPTSFAWFLDGDLVTGLPRWIGTAALVLEIPVWIAFFVRRAMLRRAGHVAPMVTWLAIVPAVNWHLGIVVFDDDRIFTITNVFLHGIPYLALVWVAGGRERVQVGLARITRRSLGVPAVLLAFYGLLVALAFTEEALWDRLVWHDHPELFGASAAEPGASALVGSAVVALLTVPQATHYLLDRYIWRAGPENPRLAEQLGFSRR
jgi:hypothetical protein